MYYYLDTHLVSIFDCPWLSNVIFNSLDSNMKYIIGFVVTICGILIPLNFSKPHGDKKQKRKLFCYVGKT